MSRLAHATHHDEAMSIVICSNDEEGTHNVKASVSSKRNKPVVIFSDDEE